MSFKLLVLTSAMVLVGCSEAVESLSVIDESEGNGTASKDLFYAGFEGIDTKTFVDADLHLYWTKDDRLSIFKCNTYNQQYRNYEETGLNYASFEKVGGAEFVTATSLTASYAIYPYNKETFFDLNKEAIHFTLPSIQSFVDNSFGLGANTMVAVTKDKDDNYLSFKNVGGYIVFKLFGEGTVIKSISLTSLAGEILAGDAFITASHSAEPVVSFDDEGYLVSTLTIDCGEEGVELGATADEAKGFWFVVPPLTFSDGFEVTFTTTDGASITKTASGSIKVARNKVYRVPAIELLFQADLTDKTEPGVYSYDADNHKVTTLCQYNAGQDQFVTSDNSFRIQNLDKGYLAGVTLPSSTITEGNSYSVSVMLYGIDGYADGTYTKTMMAEKVENGKVWLLEQSGTLGFIIKTK